MVEINLVPDVKQELIQAKRVRTIVIAGAVTVAWLLLVWLCFCAVYLFGVQTVRQNIADASIKDKGQQLADVKDLGDMITISKSTFYSFTKLHNEKNIDSRLFDLLIAINPAAPNNVVFSQTRIDANTKTIRLDGQAEAGYPAAEVPKTILGTKLSYRDGTDSKRSHLRML